MAEPAAVPHLAWYPLQLGHHGGFRISWLVKGLEAQAIEGRPGGERDWQSEPDNRASMSARVGERGVLSTTSSSRTSAAIWAS